MFEETCSHKVTTCKYHIKNYYSGKERDKEGERDEEVKS